MKMLFLAEDVSFAHVGRPSILAKWAKDFGVDVYFATGEAGKKQLQNSGWVDPIYNLNCISNNEFYKKVNEGKFFYTTEILESYIKNEVDLISKIKPDFVVSDFRLTANISCQIMGVKHISLTNAYWSPYFACPFPAPNNGIFKILPSKTTESLFRLIRPMIFKYFAKPIDSLRIKYGLAAHLDFRKTYTEGDYTLYFDLPQFVPLKNLPLHHKFIGPVNWSPNFVNDFNLPNKKLAYVTLGSTGNSKSLAMIIKTLVEKDFFVIASGINDVLSSELLKTLPLNKNQFLLKKMVNPEEFLSKCQITICHGGSGSIYQSLAQGCPF
jgi:UDP:flavonoid glycosyltransferase YjiC (YdhE family)